jgi:hypothetical protein
VRGSPILQDDFSGGLNVYDGPYQVKPNEARDVRNLQTTNRGALRKRDGSQIFAALAQQPLSLYGAMAPRYLIVAGSTFLYSIDAAKAVIQIASGLTAGRRWQWVTAPTTGGQGPLYGTNGAELRYTNGTLAGTGAWTASAGTLPVGQYVAYLNNRVFMAGMASYTTADPANTVAASNIATPRDWTQGTNQGWAVMLDPGDGDAITGFAGSGMQLTVFKGRKIFTVYDLNSGANRRLTDKTGAVAPRSIIETPYGTFFLSDNQGVCRVNGQSVERVSDKIMPVFARTPVAMRSQAVAAYHQDHLYLSISTSSGTVNDTLLDFDLKTNSWWVHSLACQDFAPWDDGTGPALYGARSSQANVQRLFVSGATQDDIPAAGGAGTNFSSYYIGPWHAFQQPYRRTRVREIHFDGKGRMAFAIARNFQRVPEDILNRLFGTESLSFGTNDAQLFGVNDTTVFGGPTDVGEAKVLNLGVSRAWSVQFGNATAEPFELDSYTFMMQNRRD